jgi:hypothetical protein
MGTGKTFIAFQIACKLFHSRWNLSDWKAGHEPSRRPRILFLADRNILADQAYNAFSAFPEDAMVRIKPEDIRKKDKVPKNASLFFSIFQTFMSGPRKDGKPSPYFGEYPPDFFDFIVIDECHRGGANDASNWRGIMDYFAPAVQFGLTATPKRKENVDTYAHFGEPAGFGGEQLAEMQKIIDPERSDLFDVLAHAAYALPTLTREERATKAKVGIKTHFNTKQETFLDFALSQYVKVGVREGRATTSVSHTRAGELDQEKLAPPLRLKYNNAIADAVADLGRPEEIGHVFSGFQKYLYPPGETLSNHACA